MNADIKRHKEFKKDLRKLLAKHDALLEMTDHESEGDFSIWIFFGGGKEPLNLGSSFPDDEEYENEEIEGED